MRQLIATLIFCVWAATASAGSLTIELSGAWDEVTFVGAMYRWDPDGLPKMADGSARVAKERAEAPRIDLPPLVDFPAVNKGDGKWVIEQNMPAGEYDLVIIKAGAKQRFEGWRYAPPLDFDPFFPPDAKVLCDEDVNGKMETVEDKETLEFIDKQIRQSKHYENKVVPLYFGGGYKKGQVRPRQVRVLVMLIRDEGTTLDGGSATMRFEIWQFEDRSGGYVKQKRTHVLHRIIMPRDQLRSWTWLWDPALGNIKIEKSGDTVLKYEVPEPLTSKLKGLRPY